jgi:hypothetical protein
MCTQSAVQKCVKDGDEFGDTQANCGWAHDHFATTFQVRDGTIDNFMPKTTVEDRSKTASLGGSTGAGGNGIGVGHQHTHGKPGVSSCTQCDSVKGRIAVTTKLNGGCQNCGLHPACSGSVPALCVPKCLWAHWGNVHQISSTRAGRAIPPHKAGDRLG